jgi:hypothetical protein
LTTGALVGEPARTMRKTLLSHVAAGLATVAFLSVAVSACKKEKDGDDTSSAAPAAPPPEAAPAPAPAGPSAPPSAQEWAGAAPANAVNAGAAGCEVKQLREWIKVACGFVGAQSGAPADIAITKPGTRDASKVATGGSMTLIYPWEPGQNLEAVFSWQKQTRGFTANWPANTPPPAAVGAFGPPAERRIDQCDTDRDCGSGRQCCLTSGSRGICNPAGKDVCRAQNLYTKCSTDAECRRERSGNSLCKYNATVKEKVCVWDDNGKRDSNDPKDKQPKLKLPKR